jgi:hypothetical protein
MALLRSILHFAAAPVRWVRFEWNLGRRVTGGR